MLILPRERNCAGNCFTSCAVLIVNVNNRYLDDHQLWTSTDFAVDCFKLIVNNVQVSSTQVFLLMSLAVCLNIFSTCSLLTLFGNNNNNNFFIVTLSL